eukprot:2191901-Pyramimonas_sp.AAC.1
MLSPKNLIRDNMPVQVSANDIVMTAGRDGRIPPTHIAQLIGILPGYNCQSNRLGQVDRSHIFGGRQSEVHEY